MTSAVWEQSQTSQSFELMGMAPTINKNGLPPPLPSSPQDHDRHEGDLEGADNSVGCPRGIAPRMDFTFMRRRESEEMIVGEEGEKRNLDKTHG